MFIITTVYFVQYLHIIVMQVDYILSVEDILHSLGIIKKLIEKPKNKKYDKYSKCEMLINKVIVLLLGGESFDSYESNQMLLKLQQTFNNSHRVR